nr:MAG TPA: hypothetical protein [Caudoviricetes sp.]
MFSTLASYCPSHSTTIYVARILISSAVKVFVKDPPSYKMAGTSS